MVACPAEESILQRRCLIFPLLCSALTLLTKNIQFSDLSLCLHALLWRRGASPRWMPKTDPGLARDPANVHIYYGHGRLFRYQVRSLHGRWRQVVTS